MGNPLCPQTPPPAPAGSTASHATLPIYSFGNIDWLHFFILVCLPALAFHGLVRFSSVFAWQSWALCVLMYCCCAYGITMGYHRLWSHRAFEASLPVRLLLAFFGAGSVQGSIRWWSRKHRYHHRFTDTELDPYNSKYGLCRCIHTCLYVYYSYYDSSLLARWLDVVPSASGAGVPRRPESVGR